MDRSRKRRPRARKRSTIFEVAALAGVSKSTVSNVITGTGRFSGETRQIVLDAIERLDYRPNTLAQHFVRQRTTILGVIVGDLENPFNASLAKLIERNAAARGYSTMFCDVEGDDALAPAGVRLLLDQRVAGILVLSHYGKSSDLEQTLAGEQLPIVFVSLRERWGDSVCISERGGAELAVDHLVAAGHRDIAYVTIPVLDRRTDRARYGGYRSALRRVGLPHQPAFRWDPATGTVRLGSERIEFRQLLQRLDRPTGFFASNDLCALELLDLTDSLGLRVPNDLSIIGFDNVTWAGLARIGLTTVAQPFEDLAQIGVDLALARIEHSSSPPRHITVPAELVVRSSTGPPPASVARKLASRA
jgi:LacI family transcriptional regulator, galactose operon repressor